MNICIKVFLYLVLSMFLIIAILVNSCRFSSWFNLHSPNNVLLAYLPFVQFFDDVFIQIFRPFLFGGSHRLFFIALLNYDCARVASHQEFEGAEEQAWGPK